jgi:hypothetical protein
MLSKSQRAPGTGSSTTPRRALGCLETLHGESLHVSQPVGGIQAGKAGAHNYCINVSVGHAATML